MENNKINTYLLGFIAVLLVVTAVVSWQTSSSLSEITGLVTHQTGQQQAAANQQAEPQQPARVNVNIGDAPSKGPEDAKVTIVVFSDPSCPYCSAAAGGEKYSALMKSQSPGWEPAVPNIIKDYVDTGKARIVFKYFPGHGAGQDAMKIMWCADEQGKFWGIHDVMFNNQDLMTAGDLAGLKKAAVDAGLDSDKLEACLSSGKYNSRFNTDTQDGSDAGVRGTPAFFINGKLIEGAVPYSTVKAAIEAELNA